MSDDIARIQSELKSLGYSTALQNSPHGPVAIFFPYKVEVGFYKGTEVTLGISMQENGYPEYPPHWIHINPPIYDEKGGAYNRYQDERGRKWIAMSRPPGPLWDQLPTKCMRAYLSEHMRRIWNGM